MSILDLQAFMRDLLSRFDEKIDTSSGSEADKVVIQPLLRREGPDPFSMDIRAFLFDRLNQEFPSFATRDGDAISDLLVKPLELLMDPVVRENQRVRANLSFRDPATMTIDEAEALGGNFFVTRDKGDFAKGAVRIYFSSPQSATLTPANFVTSRGGLTYFPDGVQSIKVDEMLFNQEGDLYYFDINVIAEQAGDQYNIEANEIVQIANFTASVKVTNKRRIRGGISAESVTDYVARIQQEITERSLVTKRGIVAALSNNFPEMTRINVAGFNDPEMQRDIVEGGGLGVVLAGGLHGFSIQDGEAKPSSRRFRADPLIDGPVDFTALIGPPTSSGAGFILVVHGTFLGTPYVKDVEVRTVVDAITLDLEEQVFPLVLTGSHTIIWELRKRELTLSKIPGGILFPDSPNGTVAIPNAAIHIGGATDSYLRGTVLDSGSLIIDGLSDDSPVLSGTQVESDGLGRLILRDLVLAPFPGANYTSGDTTFQAILDAPGKLYVLQVLDGIAPGTYTLQNSIQPFTAQGNPAFVVFPPNPVAFVGARWKLIDIIDIDLNEPKETRLSGSDLSTLQASATVTTLSGVNFNDFGVAVNDTLRILSGKDAGDFTVKQVTPFPFFTQIVLDRTVTSTASGLRFIIFRPNAAGATSLPFIRMKSIDLLDSNKQPVGSTVPYAKPIGASSFSFSNPARGVKLDLVDAHLGIVGIVQPPAGANVSGTGLEMTLRPGGIPILFSLTFTGLNPVPLSIAPGGPYPQGGIIEQINTTSIGLGVGPIAVVVGSNRLGIIPVGFTEVTGPAALTAVGLLFGADPNAPFFPFYMNSKMVRSTFLDLHDLVQEIQPPLDLAYDVVQVVDGLQIGAHVIQYAAPYPGAPIPPGTPPPGLALPHVLTIGDQYDFSPEPDTHVLLGARSLGKARLYFLEPTSFEAGLDTIFHATLANGTVLDFQPDPAMEAQIVPALPAGPKPVDGSGIAGGNVLTSPTTNFIKRQVRIGDIVLIDYIPIIGSLALADPVLNLAFTTLLIEFADGTQKTITFVHDNGAIPATAVTRAGVATQINNAVGKVICKINAGNRLEFDAQVLIIIHPTGTANPLLGFSVLVEQTNRSPYEGRYTIIGLGANQVTLTPNFPAAPPAQSNMQFSVFRRGTQRTGTTTMSTQVGPAGLYYTDVELVSLGTGDAYNLEAGVDMTLENYRSDGYYLTNEDQNLTFSTAEKVHLHVSRTINEVGTDDNPENSTNLLGQNIQTNYEFSALVANVQSFLQADLERVVCASPLARHLVPHFIRFDLQYSGGPKEADVLPDIQTLIQALFPDQQLEVSDITAILTSRGTTSIVNPITLYGVIHNVDRTISLERSQDRINVGRMAAFIPDVLNLTRNLT